MIPLGKPMVAIVAVVIATAGAGSAFAGEPVRPDPNPAATAAGLGPDPAPGSVQARSVRRVVAHREATRAVAGYVARPQTSSSAGRAATLHSAAPARPRGAPAVPRRTRLDRVRARHAGAARTASPIAPRVARSASGVEAASSSSARTPLLAAAAALAAAVLASAALLALTRRQSLPGEP